MVLNHYENYTENMNGKEKSYKFRRLYRTGALKRRGEGEICEI
jgi:hypothetical protein